jgi:hypothetical protein
VRMARRVEAGLVHDFRQAYAAREVGQHRRDCSPVVPDTDAIATGAWADGAPSGT